MRLKTNEAPVLQGCLELLKIRRKLFWRQNVGAARDETGRLIRFGIVGMSDILVPMAPYGRLLAVETKRPAIPELGQRSGKLTKDQRAFLDLVRSVGCVGVCIRDISVLSHILDVLTDMPLAKFTEQGEFDGEIETT